MEEICKKCPNITSLSLYGCWNLKDPKIKLKNMKEINLSRCEVISTNELESIINSHFETLELINIAYCRNATQKIISLISQKCFNLKSVDFSSLNIKGESIEPLFLNSKNIEYLNFSVSFQLKSL